MNDNVTEEWKYITDFPMYMVSNHGRIYSLKTQRYLSCSTDTKGYQINRLRQGGKYCSLSVHRLVGKHFIENPGNKPLIDHINCIRHDNRVSNLRWVSHAENTRNMKVSKRSTTLVKGVCFDKRSNRYFATITVDGIRTYLGYYDTIEQATSVRLEAVNRLFGNYVHSSERISAC
jgi:hypothetical protein